MGRNRALCEWKEPVFLPGTDAQRRLPVALGMTDCQAEKQKKFALALFLGKLISGSFHRLDIVRGGH